MNLSYNSQFDQNDVELLHNHDNLPQCLEFNARYRNLRQIYILRNIDCMLGETLK